MMIFSNGLDDKVRDGSKTQTRRLKDQLRDCIQIRDGEIVAIVRRRKSKWPRKLWVVGRTYAIQSGRGKKGDGRFRITKIRKENLQDISEADARAEGVRKFHNCPHWIPGEAIKSFKRLWDSIHKKPGDRWDSNPQVWVLEIELA